MVRLTEEKSGKPQERDSRGRFSGPKDLIESIYEYPIDLQSLDI